VDSIFLSPTNETEIINIAKSFSRNKSPGHDEVQPFVLKSIIVSIVTPLVGSLHDFNLSFHHGQFPTRPKLAKVEPIFENDDKLSIIDQIISVLSVFLKSSKNWCLKE